MKKEHYKCFHVKQTNKIKLFFWPICIFFSRNPPQKSYSKKPWRARAWTFLSRAFAANRLRFRTASERLLLFSAAPAHVDLIPARWSGFSCFKRSRFESGLFVRSIGPRFGRCPPPMTRGRHSESSVSSPLILQLLSPRAAPSVIVIFKDSSWRSAFRKEARSAGRQGKEPLLLYPASMPRPAAAR